MPAPQYLMKAPANVYTAIGANGKTFYVRNDGTGLAMIDADSCASLIAQGWQYADPVGKAAQDMRSAYILDQKGTPIILLSAATNISATGAITGLTALPYTPSGVVRVYVFAQAGLAAGLYYATFSSATACQLYLDAAATITPNSITAGAYASSTAEAVLVPDVLPGGALGANGALRVETLQSHANSVSAKNILLRLGGSLCGSYGPTTTASGGLRLSVRNRGSQAAQVMAFTSIGSGADWVTPRTSGVSTASINTAVDQPLTINGQLVSAADYLILEGYTIEVLPGA